MGSFLISKPIENFKSRLKGVAFENHLLYSNSKMEIL